MKKRKKPGNPAASGSPAAASGPAKTAGQASPAPEAKPVKADASAPVPENKPAKAETAPAPEAKPAEANAAPAPVLENKPAEPNTAPAPEAKPVKADASAPVPENKPAKAEAAPAPEAKPAKADGRAALRRAALRRAGRAARALCRGAWWENPVLARGLALAPILGAAFTLKNGILLAAAMGMTVLLESALALPIQRLLPRSLRPAALFVAAAAVTVPVELLGGAFAPTAASLCGIYLPLLPVCALPMAGQDAGSDHDGARVLFLALRDGLGFALAAVLISAVREIAGLGTLYDRPLPGGAQLKFSFTQSPAGAFILLGCLLALFTAIARRRKGGEHR